MFQDIYPHKFDNQFKNIQASYGDRVLCFSGDKALLKLDKIPYFQEFAEDGLELSDKLSYAFSVDDERFFVLREEYELSMNIHGYKFMETRAARDIVDRLTAFEMIMGLHLYGWYQKTKFCGCCGEKMELGTKERTMICPKCANVVYPRISPVIIVGVYNGDELLLTKYADRDYSRYALIAGFMEYGETPEDTVRREVFEEAGLRVKNIQYYKSQPWPYPDSLLLGFYAEVEGDTTPVLRDGELGEATWFKREDIPPVVNDFALTSELMENFRRK